MLLKRPIIIHKKILFYLQWDKNNISNLTSPPQRASLLALGHTICQTEYFSMILFITKSVGHLINWKMYTSSSPHFSEFMLEHGPDIETMPPRGFLQATIFGKLTHTTLTVYSSVGIFADNLIWIALQVSLVVCINPLGVHGIYIWPMLYVIKSHK